MDMTRRAFIGGLVLFQLNPRFWLRKRIWGVRFPEALPVPTVTATADFPGILKVRWF